MKHIRQLQQQASKWLARAESTALTTSRERPSANPLNNIVKDTSSPASRSIGQFQGHSRPHGPQEPFSFPWKQGAVLLTFSAGGAAVGWFAKGVSQLQLDASGLDVTALSHLNSWKHFVQGKTSEALAIFDSRPIIGPNFLADAAARAAPAVVSIAAKASTSYKDGRPDKCCGSGFITDPSGIIMTNAHVVDSALEACSSSLNDSHLRVTLQDGREFDGKVLSIDRATDLALVSISADEALPAAKLGSSGSIRVGEWVLALGSPLTLQNSVTAGIISCVGRKAQELGLAAGGGARFIQTDAAVNAGNAGGPLVNLAGEVVGISCMRALHSTGVSFAIPVDAAHHVLSEVKGRGGAVRPYVGIKMLQLNPQNAAEIQEKDSGFPALKSGILVPSVQPGSPAAEAGLAPGDVITGNLGFRNLLLSPLREASGSPGQTCGLPADFGESGRREPSTEALVEELRQHVGRPLELRVRRGRRELRLVITAREALRS